MSRSSNSPRYFAPATIAPRSSATSRLPRSDSGHVAGDDALGQPLDDGGLADAGLADEHRVVLGTPGQHLHDPADLGVAADDRVELALAGRARSGRRRTSPAPGRSPPGRREVTVAPAADLVEAPRAARRGVAPRVAQQRRRRRRRRSARPTSRCSVETYSSPRAAARSIAAASTRCSAPRRLRRATPWRRCALRQPGDGLARRRSRTAARSAPTASSSGSGDAVGLLRAAPAAGARARPPGCPSRSARRTAAARPPGSWWSACWRPCQLSLRRSGRQTSTSVAGRSGSRSRRHDDERRLRRSRVPAARRARPAARRPAPAARRPGSPARGSA